MQVLNGCTNGGKTQTYKWRAEGQEDNTAGISNARRGKSPKEVERDIKHDRTRKEATATRRRSTVVTPGTETCMEAVDKANDQVQ